MAAPPVYPYPSRFGSHKNMVVTLNPEQDGEFLAQHGKFLQENPTWVACKDERGYYLTEKNRIDSGLADPRRYHESRLGDLFGGKKKEEVK